MLGTDDDGIDTQGLPLVRILDRHLTLGVGTEVRHQVKLLLADTGEFLQESMRQVKRQRHQRRRLTTGVAEHDPLVACSLLLGCEALDTTVDISALPMDSGEDSTAIGVEAISALVVADPSDDVSGYIL